ncbi:hypothetical protein [Paractinoplanes abujensis]|uniref:hypothetical protein n=1 Tax=Paractinoplanes abujensis TaxID=882441 RepID=UPI0034DB310C
MHHVVTDGIGGLAALAALADEWPGNDPDRPFPLPAPSPRELAFDATCGRLRALRRLPGDLRRAAAGLPVRLLDRRRGTAGPGSSP